jgi:hypothetical protein
MLKFDIGSIQSIHQIKTIIEGRKVIRFCHEDERKTQNVLQSR